MGISSDIPLSMDDVLVFCAQNEADDFDVPLTVPRETIEATLGIDLADVTPDPQTGCHRALIVVSEAEAYWSNIDEDGMLDQMLVPVEHRIATREELINANETTACW